MPPCCHQQKTEAVSWHTGQGMVGYKENDTFLPMAHYVYLLRCADATYYVGYTQDVGRRLRQHNTCTAGARYTKGRRPVSLLYSEEHATQREAMARELEIKRWTRKRKELLCDKAERRP